MNLFEIVRRSPRENRNLTSPIAASAVGIAFQESAVAGVAELADGLKPLVGFACYAISILGPTLQDHVFMHLNAPGLAGGELSLEHGEEVEMEGTAYIDASVTSGTALETPLSFTAGKISTVSGQQLTFYRLKEIMTPEVAGALRIRVEQIDL